MTHERFYVKELTRYEAMLNTGMCPGLGEWWLHKWALNLQNLVSML